MNFQDASVADLAPTEPENLTGPRILAALIDLAVLMVVFVGMSIASGQAESSDGTARANLNGGPFLLYVLIVAAYYIGFEFVVRATPGKLVMGLAVADFDGDPPSSMQIVLRNLLRVVDGLPVFYLVGMITIATSKHHQRVGDLAAGTIVARRRRATVPSPPQ